MTTSALIWDFWDWSIFLFFFFLRRHHSPTILAPGFFVFVCINHEKLTNSFHPSIPVFLDLLFSPFHNNLIVFFFFMGASLRLMWSNFTLHYLLSVCLPFRPGASVCYQNIQHSTTNTQLTPQLHAWTPILMEPIDHFSTFFSLST